MDEEINCEGAKDRSCQRTLDNYRSAERKGEERERETSSLFSQVNPRMIKQRARSLLERHPLVHRYNMPRLVNHV